MSSERPFQIQRIDHVVLRVQDLPRAVRFYCDVLGCTVARERPSLGMVHLHAGESLIDLISVDGPLGREGGAAPGREGRNVEHVCLRVEPFDEAGIRMHFAQFGIEAGALEMRYGAEGSGPSLYLTDPEGNVVELKGPPAS